MSAKPMSPKQENLIRGLMEERTIDSALLARLQARIAQPVTSKEASPIIEWLLKQPRPPRQGGSSNGSGPSARSLACEAPAGRYAVEVDGDLMFFRVDKPEDGKWAGWTFVKQQSSGSFERVRGEEARKVLELIDADPQAAAIRYGKELGCCSVCAAQLTSEWREVGIGPECAKKRGWTLDSLRSEQLAIA